MFIDHPRVFKSSENRSDGTINMKARQEPLMRSYVDHPERARIIDSAATSSDRIGTADPIHTEVTFGTGNPACQKIGVHSAVGGNCDDPNPGELLSAALASCLDTTIRIVANRLGMPLKKLAVTVDAMVDVRGTLHVAKNVPVGFQSIEIGINIEPAVPLPDEQIIRLIKAAEKSCVVLQTLKLAPTITVSHWLA